MRLFWTTTCCLMKAAWLCPSSPPINQSPRLITGSAVIRTLFVAACLVLISGCQLKNWAQNRLKVGPEYCPPQASTSDRWIDAGNEHLQEFVWSDPDWWSTLNDPSLDSLIQTAYQQNLSLREAGWRVMQARAVRDINVGNLFPQSQSGFGQLDQILESESLATPVPLRSFSEWSTGFNLAWEVDVWGRYRRSIASADANLEASIGDRDAIMICLFAEVATAYTNYRTSQKQLEYAKRNVEIQESSLELTQKKAQSGATGFTGVYLATSSLESTRAGIPSIEIQLRQANNQLCTLLGFPTEDLSPMLGEGAIPTAPQDVAVGIPANLLRRRPDIRAAERSVAAQSEQIGIAMADLYPAFTITGEIAWESERLGDLFKSASNAGSIGPGFQWNLLNYGRIKNNVQLQQYGLQELIATYQGTVLNANQEVEDAVIAFLKTQERYLALQKSVEATEEALKLLTISYEEGETDFSGVFVLQGALVGSQNQLAQTQGDVTSNLIQLYKALGGGWEVRCRGFSSGDMIGPSVAMIESSDDLDGRASDDFPRVSVSQNTWTDADKTATPPVSGLTLGPISIRASNPTIDPVAARDALAIETAEDPEEAPSKLPRARR